jgi:hypothetical protein
MKCQSCPHHVRHGKPSANGKTIEFSNACGLKLRKTEDQKRRFTEFSCESFPFAEKFDYMQCKVYLDIFKSGIRRNDALPTKDFQYSEALSGISITDMELL